MAASHTLPHSPFSRKSGCLILSGFGIKLRCNAGHLAIEDGIADDRRMIRVPKIARDLKRIIVLGSDGFATFEALRWIADIGASLIFLDRRGKVLFVSGPTAPSDSRLRRSQSLALANGTALRISKELIRQKVEGQATLVREMLHNDVAANAILRLGDELPNAENIESVRLIEAQAAKLFWQTWSDVPIRWPHKDERKVPVHWKRFGSRISPLTHSPRLAANPPNAILNLLYAVLEAESRIATVAMGLDPGIGLLHVDTPSRESLIFDILEPVRAKVSAFVLNWIQSEALRESDFWEDRQGNCRLSSTLAIKLCQTADTWRRLVAPVAEYVAQELWNSTSRTPSTRMIATRLTQSTKRTVKGSTVPGVAVPKIEHLCETCGTKIRRRDSKRCAKCTKRITRINFTAGRRLAQHPAHRAKMANTMRAHKRAIANWNPADLPSWLTRDAYKDRILPALASVTPTQICRALNVSWPYTKAIQNGHIPNTRIGKNSLGLLASLLPRNPIFWGSHSFLCSRSN